MTGVPKPTVVPTVMPTVVPTRYATSSMAGRDPQTPVGPERKPP